MRPSLSSPPSTKLTRRAEVEALGIVEQSQHHVGNVAAVFPVAQPAGGHAARGAVGAGDEMRAAEEVDEQVAGHAAAIGLPLAPLEEVLGVQGNLGRRAQEPRPVAGLRGRIEGNRVVPRAHRRVAVPVGLNHVELADGAGGEHFLGLFVDHRADALAADL